MTKWMYDVMLVTHGKKSKSCTNHGKISQIISMFKVQNAHANGAYSASDLYYKLSRNSYAKRKMV